MAVRHDLVKSNIDSLLLCLVKDQAMYGYQIIKSWRTAARAISNSKKAPCIRLCTVWKKTAWYPANGGF